MCMHMEGVFARLLSVHERGTVWEVLVDLIATNFYVILIGYLVGGGGD